MSCAQSKRYTLAMRKRPKSPIQPSLFEIGKPEAVTELTAGAEVDRPYNHTNLLLGTSAFTASGWSGSFYPAGMKSKDYLPYYASKFKTVEIDSTYYGAPAASTVESWYSKTPPDFIFTAKVPQVITHEKMLLDCNAEFGEFLDRMGILNQKLGPLLLQFPRFDKYEFATGADFVGRLRTFLKGQSERVRLVVEIRNPDWVDQRFLDALRERNVALALTDTSFMPRPWELKHSPDLITADFAYVRWLGNRKQIETITTTWDKTIVDRTGDLTHWVALFRQFVARNLKVFAYANNHYAGNGPGTIRNFWALWNQR